MVSRLDSGSCFPGSWDFASRKATFCTVPLPTQMYKWEPNYHVDYHLVQGRRAITNLSSSRYEALSLVMNYLTTCSNHTGRPGDYRFLLWKSGLRASSSTARGAIKNYKSVSAPRELKYCISQFTKAVVFEGKSTPPLSYLWIHGVHRFIRVATVDLCSLRKQQKENPDREMENVPMSNFLAICSHIQ